MQSVKRDIYLKRLIDRRQNGMIKIITGIRRCGKSYLLFRLYRDYLLAEGVAESDIICLDLDDEANAVYRQPDKLYDYILSKIVSNERQYYVFLDEVQFAISAEEAKSDAPIRLYGVLNGLLRRGNVDVYVTGSNSRFLSSDIRTEFRGRGDVVEVHPLTFSEFFSAYDGDKYDAWRDYFTYGGLPYLFACKSAEQKARYLSDVFNNVYLSDVIERNNLRENNYIDDVVDVLASAVGSLTQPIFNRGTNLANLRIAKAQQESALISFQQSILNAGSEVSNALFLYQAAEDKMVQREKQIDALVKSVEYTQELLMYGTSTYLEVLTAQQSLLNAQLSGISDEYQRIQAVINLYHALGGGRTE